MRNHIKKTALLLSLIIATSAVLSACGAPAATSSTAPAEQSKAATTEAAQEPAASGEAAKLKMITYLGNPQRDSLIQELIADVPNIELEIISPPSDQAQQKIETMLQSGDSLDILEFDSITVKYVKNGFIEPLNTYVEAWDDWASVSPFLKDQLTSYDGNVYSVPYGVYERALFYRKDWFEEKGLKVPKTWDELYATAKTLTDPAQNRYGYSFRGGGGTSGFQQMQVLSTMKKEDMDISTPFIARDGRSVYQFPEAVEALTFYKKLYDDVSHPDSISWGYPEMVEAFYSGVTAMLIQDPEVIATCEEYMEEGTWDVAPLPIASSGRALFPAGFAGWAIPANSKNKEAAFEVIKALSSVEGNAVFCKKNGSIPIHTEAQKDPFFSEGYYGCYIEMANDPEHYTGYVDGGETRFATKEELAKLNDLSSQSDSLVQAMLLGRTTPEQLAGQLGEFYAWSTDSQWVKDRYK